MPACGSQILPRAIHLASEADARECFCSRSDAGCHISLVGVSWRGTAQGWTLRPIPARSLRRCTGSGTILDLWAEADVSGMAVSGNLGRGPRFSNTRRGLCCVLLALAAAGAFAASTFASGPPDFARWAKRHHHFHGLGEESWNNGPRFRHVLVGFGRSALQWRFTFETSRDGSHVLHFRGEYSYYCGNGTRTFSGRDIPISFYGDFRDHGSATVYVDGRFEGTEYFSLIGAPAGHGNVIVSYMFELVYPGKHLSHPYRQVYRRPDVACQSVVLGAGRWR